MEEMDKETTIGPIGVNEQTPREIVAELDKYIVGQDEAKRSVAIALRNRWRARQLTGAMKEDIIPKNILMIGSTGVSEEMAFNAISKATRDAVNGKEGIFTKMGVNKKGKK